MMKNMHHQTHRVFPLLVCAVLLVSVACSEDRDEAAGDLDQDRVIPNSTASMTPNYQWETRADLILEFPGTSGLCEFRVSATVPNFSLSADTREGDCEALLGGQEVVLSGTLRYDAAFTPDYYLERFVTGGHFQLFADGTHTVELELGEPVVLDPGDTGAVDILLYESPTSTISVTGELNVFCGLGLDSATCDSLMARWIGAK